MQRRKVTYKLYPSAAQARALEGLLRAHKDLWNAALEERIDAWRKARRSISFQDQSRALTEVRQVSPEDWAAMNCSSQQVTLRRLDKAFKAFFARCARGQTPGFPRYKSLARMPGFGYKSHGDGWRFSPNLASAQAADGDGAPRWGKHATLRLQGVGHIKCRGQARAGGVIKSCELLHRRGQWHLSVTVECAQADLARARSANHAMAADWGVKKLLSIVRTDGAHGEAVEVVDNPRWFGQNQARLAVLERAVSAKKLGSKNWRKACRARSRLKAKMARQRHDHQHQVSADIARRCAVFATEALAVKNMTRSAAGTASEPGRNVAAKSGLNREILDTAPAALLSKVAYKVRETGALYLEAPTGALKPSQTCPACGARQKKALSQRWHCCSACGHEEDRDLAAARVVLRWALGTLGEVPIGSGGQELAEAA
jgi:putative transposase